MSDDRPQAFVDGAWLPSVPLPFYVRSWRTGFRWRYQCECGSVWHTERSYGAHWIIKHRRVPGKEAT